MGYTFIVKFFIGNWKSLNLGEKLMTIALKTSKCLLKAFEYLEQVNDGGNWKLELPFFGTA